MKDRTSDSGDERYASGRSARTPDDEWAPGEAGPGRRLPGEGGPRERLPGEPGEGAPAGNADRLPGEGTSGRLPGSTGPGREGLTADDRMPGDGLTADDRIPRDGLTADDRMPGDRMPGDRLSADDRISRDGPGADGPMPREGRTADDRMPADAAQPPPPPGPAGMPVSGDAAGPGSGTHGRPHGSEGLRPGTEDLGPDTPPASGRGADAYEERRMPDDGLGAAYTGEGTAYAADDGSVPGGTGRTTAPGTGAAGAGSAAAGTGAGSATSDTGAPLLPHDEADQWEQRMRQVVAGFVDEPRGAVEEADRALEEITVRFTEAVTQRRRTLRRSWESAEESGRGADTDTEQLRLALRDYRELAGRLLHG
jgi:hypothetical protein